MSPASLLYTHMYEYVCTNTSKQMPNEKINQLTEYRKWNIETYRKYIIHASTSVTIPTTTIWLHWLWIGTHVSDNKKLLAPNCWVHTSLLNWPCRKIYKNELLLLFFVFYFRCLEIISFLMGGILYTFLKAERWIW